MCSYVWALILRNFCSWFQYNIEPKTPMSHYITLIGDVLGTRNHIGLYFVCDISYSILIFVYFAFYYGGYYRKSMSLI